MYTSLESLWQDTIVKDPSSWMAYNNLAGLRMDAGRLDEAIRYYERTSELKPDHPNAPNNIGQIHLLRDEIDEAERWLLRAVQNDSDFAPPHVNRLWSTSEWRFNTRLMILLCITILHLRSGIWAAPKNLLWFLRRPYRSIRRKLMCEWHWRRHMLLVKILTRQLKSQLLLSILLSRLDKLSWS